MIKKTVFILTVCFIVPISGFSQGLDNADKSYITGDFSCALTESLSYSGDNKTRAEYLAGLSYLSLTDYSQARNCFRRVIKSGDKEGQLSQSAMVKLGDAYFLDNDMEKAERAYVYLLESYPATAYKPLLFLRLAQVYAKSGQWDKEKFYLAKIEQDYPDSIEREFAMILVDRGYSFTVQVGAFSRESNARELARELKYRYPVYVVEERIDSAVFYKIRVGKYSQRCEAMKVYEELVDKGYSARIFP